MPESTPSGPSALEAFAALELHVGTVLEARPNPGARGQALVLELDLGGLGRKTSSARLGADYEPAALVGSQVVCATNLGVRRVAGVRSEVLVLAAVTEGGATILLRPDRQVAPGTPVH
mgnify:CR=1 FL=1